MSEPKQRQPRVQEHRDTPAPDFTIVPRRGSIYPIGADQLRKMGIPLERFRRIHHPAPISRAQSKSFREWLDKKQTPEEQTALREWLTGKT